MAEWMTEPLYDTPSTSSKMTFPPFRVTPYRFAMTYPHVLPFGSPYLSGE